MFFYRIEHGPFLSESHFIHKALSDVSFPTTKDEIIKDFGHVKVRCDHDAYKTIEEYVAPLKVTEFSCACQFYCALYATGHQLARQ